jgi:hypothetical protein
MADTPDQTAGSGMLPGGTGVATPPPQATAAPQPTTATQPQPQAQAQTAPQALSKMPAAPQKPGSFFHNISHAFMGAVLGQAATDGKRTGGFGGQLAAETDPETGKVSYKPIPMSVGQRMSTLATRMLSGLASVPDTPENPSPIKGLGQGFVAAQKQKTDQIDREKENEATNFKRAQELKMQQYNMALSNATTLHLGMETLKAGMEPYQAQIAANESILKAVQESTDLAGKLDVQYVNDQQKSDLMKDKHFINSRILDLGRVSVLGPNGAPIQNIDGSLKTEHRWGIISSSDPDLMKNGNIVIPPAIANDIAEYGPSTPGLNSNVTSLVAGTELPFGQFNSLMQKIDEQKTKVRAGWNIPKIVLSPDDGKTPMFANSLDANLPARPIRFLTPEFEQEQALKGKTDAEAAAEKAKAAESYGKAREANANAAQIAAGMGDLPPGSPQWTDAYNKAMTSISQLPPERRQAAVAIQHQYPGMFVSLLAASNGDIDPKNLISTRKGQVGRIPAVEFYNAEKLLNPEFSDQMYKNKQDVLHKMVNKNGDAITSINNFAGHLGQMKTYADQAVQSNSPILNLTIAEAQKAYAGKPELSGLQVSVIGPRDEWQNIIKNGHAPDAADSQESKTMLNPASTIGQILSAGGAMANQAFTRLSNIDQEFQRAWGHGGHFPGIITPESAAGLRAYGLGSEIDPYVSNRSFGGAISTSPDAQQNNSGAQNPQSGQPAPPQGASQVVKVNGQITGYVVNGQYVPNAPATTPQQ